MKQWLITAEAPVCGTKTCYIAYSKENPLEHSEIEDEIIQDLWDNYSYLLHIDDDEFDSEEEREEAWDQAWEDWRCDCSICAEEATDEEILDNAPGGDVNCLEIIYNEKNEE